MTCVTGHITEPARQVTQGVFEVSQAFATGGQERPSVLEVCAGEANTTAVFKEEGHRTCRPRDLIYGDDIMDPAVRWNILHEKWITFCFVDAQPKLVQQHNIHWYGNPGNLGSLGYAQASGDPRLGIWHFIAQASGDPRLGICLSEQAPVT